jgi:hypothetical protein
MAAASGTARILYGTAMQSVSIYCADTSDTLVTFDESKIAVAGSNDGYVAKAAGKLVDVCLTSDVATPTHIQVMRNGAPTGDILDCTAQLASVVARPNPRVSLNKGDKLQLMML